MRTPKPYEVVVVTWEDARTDATAQFDSPEAAIASYKPCFRPSAIGAGAGGIAATPAGSGLPIRYQGETPSRSARRRPASNLRD